MADTITYESRVVSHIYTPDELNAIFDHIKEVMDAKADIRGGTMTGDLRLSSGASIINVPAATTAGDLIPYGDR